MSLIRRLPEGPLDIVGDVHGELDALRELLARLGYDQLGRHARGRRLLFVGDLGDRGPDSPGVFALVRRVVESGRGDCILGNHELNLLLGGHKQGNGWFFDESEDHDLRKGLFGACRRLPRGERAGLLDFIRAMPLACERDDLRVVHACWHEDAVRRLRLEQSGEVLHLYRDSERRHFERMQGTELHALAEAEEALFAPAATDRTRPPPAAPNFARSDELYQNSNPVRLTTSGPEAVTGTPFFSAGKWRLLDRVRWWEHYAQTVPVVFGHYWRVPQGMDKPQGPDVLNPFGDIGDGDWLGPRRSAFCVDYCVGARYLERGRGETRFRTRLGALRWPEALLLMEDGRTLRTVPGSGPSG